MKAFYFKKLSASEEEVIIDDDQVHHFTHVLRGGLGESVLVLNGKGLSCYGVVSSIKKKSIKLVLNDFSETERVIKSEIAVGIPKKEYLMSVLRSCTEIGVKKVHLIKMDHSPSKTPPDDKIEKVMVSALIQCNSIHLPEIAHYSSLSEFFEKVDHEHIVVFSTELKESIGFKASSGVNTCAIIGPEGGFSELELNLCQATEKVNLVSLSNPIMKTITAVPFCLGYLQS